MTDETALAREAAITRAAILLAGKADKLARATGDPTIAPTALARAFCAVMLARGDTQGLVDALDMLRERVVRGVVAETEPHAESVQVTAEDGVPPEAAEKMQRIIRRLLPTVRKAAAEEGGSFVLGAMQMLLLNLALEWTGDELATQLIEIAAANLERLIARKRLSAAEPAGSA